jgi:hypothetical protein
MRDMIEKTPYKRFSPDTIIINSDQYIFLTETNTNPERIYGLIVASWRKCGRVILGEDILYYLQTHTIK